MSSSSKAALRAQKAAEMRAAQERQERRRRLLTIGGAAVAMLLLVGGIIAFSVWQQNQSEKDLEAAAGQPSDYGVAIGPEDAPHTVVIYEDFLCPYCGELEAATREDLASLAADGKVRVEYRPFDLLSASFGDYPIRATNAFAVVLEKSGPEVAKRLHDLLYEHQPPESDPDSVTDDDLVELAVEAGATETDVRDGIESLAQEAWVEQATAEAKKAGVTGTPTVLLDGQVFDDGRNVDDLAANLIAQVE
ncbi:MULTISPECIES: DsbA family protein [Nocardioides]|uniref:DsbA family protein n=1 Tax=Nocardioides vastitatis TaxID=2568655 RepID=A0ABW0ZAM3_9ACTN|nr:thioredoxin domain-containing protein [Nocardioides sp.]THJ05336.1 disulfide bond formation protein DsbA [Nocardioides sp.]